MVDNDRIQAAIKAAISTRGPNAGRLKRKQPPYGTDALAAWCAIILQANPYKVSPFTIMMFTDEQHTILRAVERGIEGLDVRTLDRDRVALEIMSAW